MNAKTRGRFTIERDLDGFTLVDGDTGGCISFDTKTEAERSATFVRAYVKRWGRIDFNSFPWSLDEAPAALERGAAGAVCPACRREISAEPTQERDGLFYGGHGWDCPRYGTRVAQDSLTLSQMENER